MRLLLVLVFALASLGWQPSRAAEHEAVVAAEPEPVSLVIGERKVVVFRAPMRGYTPAERAEGAKRRALEAYAKNPRPKLETREIAEGTQVLADGAVLFTVAHGDVNELSGDTTRAVAQEAVGQIHRILRELQDRTDPAVLLKSLAIVLLATLGWIVLLRLLWKTTAWITDRLGKKIDDTVSSVRLLGVSVFDQNVFLGAVSGLTRALAWALAFVLFYLWLNVVLETIPHTRPWGDQLTQILVNVLVTIGTGLLNSMPGLTFVVAIFLMARFTARTGRAFFDRVRRQHLKLGWLDRDTAPPTAAIFTLVVWLFALAMAYPYLPGSGSEAFQGLSVLVGLMVSIGASGTVSQATSGLLLMYTRAFRVGEYVRVQDIEGTVVEVGLFATRIRTGMGVEVMVPNTVVLGNSSRNFSRASASTNFVLDTSVTIGYDTPWRQVEAMLLEAASRVASLAQKPSPVVYQTELSDFYVAYRLVAHADTKVPVSRAALLSELHKHIQDVFNEYGVQIMSPHYEADPNDAKVVAKRDWFPAPAKAPDDAPDAPPR